MPQANETGPENYEVTTRSAVHDGAQFQPNHAVCANQNTTAKMNQ
jgi:hypothetical protein